MISRASLFCFLSACGLLALSGCGARDYETRLMQTAEYFEYVETLNQNLASEWQAEGIRLRVPKQFTLMPAPVVPKPEEGQDPEDVEIPPDMRQPNNLDIDFDIEFPGIVDAWQAQVAADAVGDEDAFQPAYLYVLSNGDRLRAVNPMEASDPTAFIMDVENLLSNHFGVILPAGDRGDPSTPNVRYGERLPKTERYSVPQNFAVIHFSDTEAVEAGDPSIDVQMYEHATGDLQVVILAVYPSTISPQEDLNRRLSLAMETLRVSSERAPARSSAPASGGGGGAAPSVGF